METITHDITFLEADCIRRATNRVRNTLSLYDVVYVILKNGMFYLLKNDLPGMELNSDKDVFKTEAEYLAMFAPGSTAKTLSIHVAWFTEEDVIERMKPIKGKFWFHPETSSIFKIGDYRPPSDVIPIGRLAACNMSSSNVTYVVSSNSGMFDYIWETDPKLFFDTEEKLKKCVAHAWRHRHHIRVNR